MSETENLYQAIDPAALEVRLEVLTLFSARAARGTDLLVGEIPTFGNQGCAQSILELG